MNKVFNCILADFKEFPASFLKSIVTSETSVFTIYLEKVVPSVVI
jgi:hypothetical protein